MKTAKEILINAFAVSPFQKKNIKTNNQFEFIINDNFKLLECVQLFIATSQNDSTVTPIENIQEIHNVLFELNHVRVNPTLNNNSIVSMLMNTLFNIGVRIDDQPSNDSMAICFQPLGEIKDNVRFYIEENDKMIFLANTAKPKLVKLNQAKP